MEYTKRAQNSFVKFEMGKVKFYVLMAKYKRNTWTKRVHQGFEILDPREIFQNNI